MLSMEIETTSAALPDDSLAVVLGRLPARSLASSRGVCKAWRDLIDDRRLLLCFLLPKSLRGIFFNSGYPTRPQLLSRPTPTSTSSSEDVDDGSGRRFIDGKLDFVQLVYPDDWYEVVDHCNGLLLIRKSGDVAMHVCNPATRWSARLPPQPQAAVSYYSSWYRPRRAFLVFDPFVSLEYKVLLSPDEPERKQMENDDICRRMEWPPSAWATWHEFSSRTRRWEEKVFVREGEAAGAAGDLLLKEGGNHVRHPYHRYAAYWKGALYIHCSGEFVSRFSLLDDKYRVIKLPIKLAHWKNKVPYFLGLGRSEKGVYFAALTTDAVTKLQVWTLSESSNNELEWVPKDQNNLKLNTYSWCMNNKFDKAKYWTASGLEPGYWNVRLGRGRNTQDESSLEQNVCWNSDDDNIVEVSNDRPAAEPNLKFLGFHPYKEVIFLCSSDSPDNVVAFHLNSPKVQYLATVYHGILESFVYTPCGLLNED